MKIIDMHCDTISTLKYNRSHGKNEGLCENSLHIDLCKLRKSNYLAQNFAIYLELDKSKAPFQDALALIQLFYNELNMNSEQIAFAKNIHDLQENESNGKLSAFLTLEEGGMLEGNLANLQTLYDLGARMMTFTWNYPNELGYPNCDNSKKARIDTTLADTTHGLTKLGIECMEEMERLGMLIDVSHLSDAGFYDVIKYSKQPFVASHSNARSICNHVRNLSDDMIKQLANRGGIVGMNYYPVFLCNSNHGVYQPGTIAFIIQHIKHFYQIGGIECIGLGSDFDGMVGHEELYDASTLSKLYDALGKSGFTSNQIDKIFYQNVLRIYQEVLK